MKKKHERKAGTHFEQVSLEVVKRIAEVDVAKHEKTGTDVVVELVSGKREPNRVPARSRDGKRR
jgi:hypothetical protein